MFSACTAAFSIVCEVTFLPGCHRIFCHMQTVQMYSGTLAVFSRSTHVQPTLFAVDWLSGVLVPCLEAMLLLPISAGIEVKNAAVMQCHCTCSQSFKAQHNACCSCSPVETGHAVHDSTPVCTHTRVSVAPLWEGEEVPVVDAAHVGDSSIAVACSRMLVLRYLQ